MTSAVTAYITFKMTMEIISTILGIFILIWLFMRVR